MEYWITRVIENHDSFYQLAARQGLCTSSSSSPFFLHFTPLSTIWISILFFFCRFCSSARAKKKENQNKRNPRVCNLFHHKMLSELDAILICRCADDEVCCVEGRGDIIKVEQMLTWNETKQNKAKTIRIVNYIKQQSLAIKTQWMRSVCLFFFLSLSFVRWKKLDLHL